MEEPEWPAWPQLSRERPADVWQHAAIIRNDFSAVQRFLEAVPAIPRAIANKIKEGIAKGLHGFGSLEYGTKSISVEDRVLINATLKQVTDDTALSLSHVLSQHLVKTLQESFEDFHSKLSTQNLLAEKKPNLEDLWTVPSDNPALAQSPPDSTEEDTDSSMSSDEGSDTEDSEDPEEPEWIVDYNQLESRINILEGRLQEVESERQTVDRKLAARADKIREEMRQAERELRISKQRCLDRTKRAEKNRQEQDTTGDYETGAVGYKVHQAADIHPSKRNHTASAMVLGIQKQSVVNRLFNMPANVLMQKAITAITSKVEGEKFSTITRFLGAELLDSGDVCLWANRTDEYDWRTAEDDAFDGLDKIFEWDQDIVAGFGTHLIEPTDTYSIEMKALELEAMSLPCRKRKAYTITKLVQANTARIPGLHIDHIKDIRLRLTGNGEAGRNMQALEVDFSDPRIANDALSYGLFWQGSHHYCEVYDKYFFIRCSYCQIYGHPPKQCSGTPRCASCAGPHMEELCLSAFERCPMCDGDHKATFRDCPAKKARKTEKMTFRFPINIPNQPQSPAIDTEPRTPSPVTCPTQKPAEVQEEQRFIDLEDYHVSEAEPAQVAPPGTPTLLAQQLQEKLQETLPAIEAALQADVSAMQRRRVVAPVKKRASSQSNRSAQPWEEQDEIL